MVYLVCVESGDNHTDLNISPISGKSMMEQLISKKVSNQK